MVQTITWSLTIKGQISAVQAAMSEPSLPHYLKTESVSSPHSGFGDCNIGKKTLAFLLPKIKPRCKIT